MNVTKRRNAVGAMADTALTALCATLAAGCIAACLWYRQRQRELRQGVPCTKANAYESLIGKTPCILLPNLSQRVGRQIFVKLESWNPGGTGKDRAAESMIASAEAFGDLPQYHHYLPHEPTRSARQLAEIRLSTKDDMDSILKMALQRSFSGGLVVEGSSGSTGISLAAIVVLPDDHADEKRRLLEALGAVVHVVPTASISNPQHYVNVARILATRAKRHGFQAVFIDQFNNLANFRVHYETTGPEIWKQCHPTAFVMSAGTGGTIAGVAKYLKEQKKSCRIVLADPPGSVLYSKVEHGVAFSPQQGERTLLRHRYDTIAEGIGLDRVTANMSQGLPYIDCAITVNDQDAVDMAHFILKQEGLMIGSSSAMNIVAAVETALQLPSGSSRVCTVICDSGQRHVSRFWNRDFILSRGLHWPFDNANGLPQCLRDL
jgi:cysteine synthase